MDKILDLHCSRLRLADPFLTPTSRFLNTQFHARGKFGKPWTRFVVASVHDHFKARMKSKKSKTTQGLFLPITLLVIEILLLIAGGGPHPGDQ